MPKLSTKHKNRKSSLEELRARRQQLLRQWGQLQEYHSSLQYEHALLSALCDSLSYLQLVRGHLLPQQPSAAHPDLGHNNQQFRPDSVSSRQHLLEALLTAEHGLMGQLQGLPVPPLPLQLLQACGRADGLPTIAPPEDPLALFKDWVTPPLAVDVHSLTSRDLTLLYREAIKEASLQLHQLEGGVTSPQDSSKLMAAAWRRVLKPVLWCALEGHDDVVQEYASRNIATLEMVQQDTAELLACHEVAMASLGLTVQQEEVMARLVPVWTRILAPIQQEVRQLIQLLGLDASSSNSSSSPTGSSATGDAGTGPRSGRADPGNSSMGEGQQADGLPTYSTLSRQARLDATRRRAERLTALMQRRGVLNTMFYGWLLGRLTWPQLTKLCVLTYPYTASLQCLAKAAERRYLERCREGQAQGVAGAG